MKKTILSFVIIAASTLFAMSCGDISEMDVTENLEGSNNLDPVFNNMDPTYKSKEKTFGERVQSGANTAAGLAAGSSNTTSLIVPLR